MYQVLYYLKGQPCDIKKGFLTRQLAWAWVESQLENIDWYRIEKQQCNN
jgi:hypothetical protein